MSCSSPSPASQLFAPHVNFCRNYHSGRSDAVKFVDLDENYCTTLGHGKYAQRDTQALAFLREKVSALEFPKLRVAGAGENARRQIASLREPDGKKDLVFWERYPLPRAARLPRGHDRRAEARDSVHDGKRPDGAGGLPH